jgi:hypothetical protein
MKIGYNGHKIHHAIIPFLESEILLEKVISQRIHL